jgi:AcrR family transcriptional regulator
LLVIRSAEQLAVRARILAVARRIFAHSRHGQISITDIARAADLPEDEVQLHFGDMAAVEAAVHRVFGSDRYTACRQVVELVKVREDAHLAL